MEYFLLILVVLLSVVGVVLAVLQLPGAWLILAVAIGYDAYFDWQRLGWKWLAGLAALAVAAEVADALASAIATHRAGASRRAAIGALIGGFVGMIALSLPVPLIGTVFGGLVGCFVGAMAAELTLRDDLVAGARVGMFATMGRVAGLAAKTAAAMVIAGVTVILAIGSTW
jgi:hypothetical protein